jgi:hypothetical protein
MRRAGDDRLDERDIELSMWLRERAPDEGTASDEEPAADERPPLRASALDSLARVRARNARLRADAAEP